jgi:hypothetical protein
MMRDIRIAHNPDIDRDSQPSHLRDKIHGREFSSTFNSIADFKNKKKLIEETSK